MTTPLLGMTEWTEGQTLPATRGNELVRCLEFFAVGGPIKDRDILNPTGLTPVSGDAYLINGVGAGAWTGKDGKIAYYLSTGWLYFTPIEGMSLRVMDENVRIEYSGSSWSAYGSTGTAFEMVVACSDETTALTAGTSKITFPMPVGVTLSEVSAFLVTAQTSGSIFTVDINSGGTSILSTKITIDNTEQSSTTAATPPVISTTTLANGAIVTVDIDQIGDGTAKGLKVILKGVRS